MERLTEKDQYSQNYKIQSKNLNYHCVAKDKKGYVTYYGEHIDKLAEYEDLEEQGLLLLLPVKAGDTVYRYVEEKGCVLEYTVWNISMSAYESGGIDIVIEGCAESEDEVEDEFSLSLIDFKKEFFNTRAEAEQKLKEMESERDGNT